MADVSTLPFLLCRIEVGDDRTFGVVLLILLLFLTKGENLFPSSSLVFVLVEGGVGYAETKAKRPKELLLGLLGGALL